MMSQWNRFVLSGLAPHILCSTLYLKDRIFGAVSVISLWVESVWVQYKLLY